jgi:hypothetical protein
MEVNDFITQVAQGNASAAKDALSELLSQRTMNALETRKMELAHNVFNSEDQSAEISTEEETENTEEQ